MNETICAVVVTFNRLDLLKVCIDSLRKQTRKLDKIIVVNNDSTDGTKEWLEEQKDLTKIHQENLGGAGGFHNGMKAAYEKGHDWMWLMDDDCLPQQHALYNLIKYIDKYTVLSSLVISANNEDVINFGIEDIELNKYYRKINEITTEVIAGANFFNGTLVNKKVISEIGYPNPLFFIYGDEYEYYLRILKNNIKIITVVNSRVTHTQQQHQYIGSGILFHRLIEFSQLSVKYVPRNLAAICFYYKSYSFRRLLKTFTLDLIGLIFYQKKIKLVILYIYSILQSPKLIFDLYRYK